jgi:hypothetical protein
MESLLDALPSPRKTEEKNFAPVSPLPVGQHQQDDGRRGVGHLALLVMRLPCSSFSAAWRWWPRSSASSNPAGAAGRIGHARAPLVEDQIQVGAQPVPTLLEGRDARCGC